MKREHQRLRSRQDRNIKPPRLCSGTPAYLPTYLPLTTAWPQLAVAAIWSRQHPACMLLPCIYILYKDVTSFQLFQHGLTSTALHLYQICAFSLAPKRGSHSCFEWSM
jgi:hypothetical protein